jgi:hypothetical protein
MFLATLPAYRISDSFRLLYNNGRSSMRLEVIFEYVEVTQLEIIREILKVVVGAFNFYNSMVCLFIFKFFGY